MENNDLLSSERVKSSRCPSGLNFRASADNTGFKTPPPAGGCGNRVQSLPASSAGRRGLLWGKNPLLQKLKEWRKIAAKQENVALFRVLPNRTLENIARLKPATKEDLLTIKGIKEKKFEKYGKDILALINKGQEKLVRRSFNEGGQEFSVRDLQEKVNEKPISVSKYLNSLNSQLRQQKARIQGEISSLDIRENVIYFSLKDREDESVLNCLIWKRDYQFSGIIFEVGMEIILEGYAEVYKLNGRLSFKASVAELVGEGALKKAYDQLKNKLEAEGLFAPERKKPIPEFPQKIGLVTSETGEVIHDFLTNLGRYGYQIKFMDSRVEGQAAVRDLLSAIDYFDGKDIDVLVIIRGGGSLESLQAFNNETLVRRIAGFAAPVICGIGHERDVPLASLAADLMVSTPTAAAVILNKSWGKALDRIKILEQDIIYRYQRALTDKNHQLERSAAELREVADFIFEKFRDIKQRLDNKLAMIAYGLEGTKKTINRFRDMLLINFQKKKDWLVDYLGKAQERLRIVNPMRQLKLGYSIASAKGKIVRSVQQVQRGDEVDILVSDGRIKSQVNNISNK